MRILCRDLNSGQFLCYAQVRDIKYLYNLTTDACVGKYYNFLKKHNKQDTDFVKLDDAYIADLVLSSDMIIDFNDYVDTDPVFLARVIANSFYDSRDCEIKNDALRDIISFQKGDLYYKIPLLYSGTFASMNGEGSLWFYESVVPGTYVFKTKDNTLLSDHDYKDFYKSSICEAVIREKLDMETANIKEYNHGTSIIVIITEKEKVKVKKENVFKKLAKKFNEKK